LPKEQALLDQPLPDQENNSPVKEQKESLQPPEVKATTQKVQAFKPVMALKSLAELKQEVEEEEKKRADKKSSLDGNTLMEYWMAYASDCPSPSTRILLEQYLPQLDGNYIIVMVGTQLAKNAIIQETKLLDYIRLKTHTPELLLKVEIDPALNREKEGPSRPVTTAEKYQHLVEKNPLLEKLVHSLHLKPEE
jgi:hypothetical protein